MIMAVKKATDILMVLSDNQNNPLPLGKIADLVGMHKATCAHIIGTLCESLMVRKLSRKEGYVLGPLAYYLTRYGYYQQELIKVCQPILRWLYEQVQSTVQLTIICEGTKFIINCIEGDEKLPDPGSKIKLDNTFSSASGRVILSYMEAADVEHVFNKIGPPRNDQWPGIDTIEKAYQELQRIRKDGYAVVHHDASSSGYACPIRKNNKILAAIGITVNQSKYNEETNQFIISKMKSAAREINRRVNFTIIKQGPENQ